MALHKGWLLSGALLLAAGPALAVEMGPHARIACSDCHLKASGGRTAKPWSLIADQEFTCLGCHDDPSMPHRINHPVFVVPRIAIPADWPLDAQGRLTCSTCHSIHQTAPTLLRTAGSWGCLDCHDK